MSKFFTCSPDELSPPVATSTITLWPLCVEKLHNIYQKLAVFS